MLATQSCSATDLPDKVYALLALASNIPLEADYNQEIEWVYVQVAAWLTTQHQDPEHYAMLTEPPSSLDGRDYAVDRLRSWAPYLADHPRIPRHSFILKTQSTKPSHSPELIMKNGLPSTHTIGLLNYPTNFG